MPTTKPGFASHDEPLKITEMTLSGSAVMYRLIGYAYTLLVFSIDSPFHMICFKSTTLEKNGRLSQSNDNF